MKKVSNIILVLIILAILGFLPALARVLTAEDGIGSSTLSFIWIMFPAWIYLGGALTMLTLAIKYMAGGSLSKPFSLMGLGVLVDSIAQILSSLMLINLLPIVGVYSQAIFVISLISRLAVVLGMIWIANIFGVLKNQ